VLKSWENVERLGMQKPKKGLLAVGINKNIIDDLFYPEEEEKKVMRMCWKT
jgi:hypothetical protein